MRAGCWLHYSWCEISSDGWLWVFSEIIVNESLNETGFANSCLAQEHKLNWFHLHFYQDLVKFYSTSYLTPTKLVWRVSISLRGTSLRLAYSCPYSGTAVCYSGLTLTVCRASHGWIVEPVEARGWLLVVVQLHRLILYGTRSSSHLLSHLQRDSPGLVRYAGVWAHVGSSGHSLKERDEIHWILSNWEAHSLH